MKFLGDQGVFLPSCWFSKPEKLQKIDVHPVNSKKKAQISPLIQTMAEPCRLRNIKVKILSGSDDHVPAGTGCAGDIILGKPFMKASGLDVKDFLANNIEWLSSIDYSELQIEDNSDKVGKLELSLY